MKLLYIGNALLQHGATPTSADILPELFRKEGYEVEVSSSKKNILFRLVHMLWSILGCRSSAEYILIDTYSTRNFWYAYCCSQLCRLLGLKYIPILHGGELPKRMDRSVMMAKAILLNSHCNVTPSLYLKEAAERMGYSASLVPNTISTSDYAFKERADLKPRLFYVRAFAALYNPHMALRVLKGLLPEYPEAKLCMVGPDKDGALGECKQLAKDLGIADKVSFPGRLSKDEWHKLSCQYDIFINTTNKDNTPVSVIEAMALGMPVVSTNPGGIPYLIEHGEDGLLVDTGDVGSMVEGLRKLLNDSGFANSIARKARLKAEAFDWDRVKLQWKELLCQKIRD